MRLASFVVLLNDLNEVLLCHRRDQDLWNLPGGGGELGESPEERAVRETAEEVGLQIELVCLTGIYYKEVKKELVFAYIGRTIGGSLQTSEESDETRYFGQKRLPSNNAPRHIQRIHDALKFSGEVFLRYQ